MFRSSNSIDRTDVYARITAQIVAAIKTGAGAWRMPWHHDGSQTSRPINLKSGKRYRGINVLALWVAADSAGYTDGLWGTYKQWNAAGAQVRKGERATTVVLWKEFSPNSHNDEETDTNEEGRSRLFARAFSVFNRAQVDNYTPLPTPVLSADHRIAHADRFFAALQIAMVSGAFDAHYRISEDRIYMPTFGSFASPADYAGTLFHESAHATGAKHRLDRDFGKGLGERARALEEAVAELTASYVLADLGVAHNPRPDHAAYIASWLKLLKDDPRAIFTAASKAQQAADWMHAQQQDRIAA